MRSPRASASAAERDVSKTRPNSRLLAARVVQQVADKGESLDAALATIGAHPDRGFIQELCYGVCRWYPRLDGIAARLLQRPLKQKDRDVHALILVGLYQLLELGTEAFAAVHETVEATKDLRKPWAQGLVNACLRRAQREQPTLRQYAHTMEVLHYSHPQWLIDRIKADYPDQWQTILNANNERPPMHLRVNARKWTRADYLAQLADAGIDASAIGETDSGIALTTPLGVERLPGFADGAVSVQDGAAQLAALLLDAQPGERVLDACAAPGGKAMHLLERQAGLSGLVMVEQSGARAQRIRENAARLGLDGTLHIADAAAPDSWWDGVPFDRILLDAPCSATGVIRRHPDIRLHRSPQQVADVAALQARLLDALWPLLRPNGKLLYVTCSVLHEENGAQMESFCARHRDAALRPLALDWALARSGGYQILPGQRDFDGFFYAFLEKV
jgi:16S rRNA (cytosine967-C5)-methyltransferase